MNTDQSKTAPILEIAWTRFAQLDANAFSRSKSHIRIRYWIALFGVFATMFAILSQIFPRETTGLIGFVFRILLISAPIFASILAAIAAKNYSGGDWLVKRAGAEEILKEIYLYRTVLQKSPGRRKWLEKRLIEIQRDVFQGLSGEMALKPFKGSLPPAPRYGYPGSDPGFNDLTGEEYFQYRLIPQRDWHVKEVNKFQAERSRLQWLIYLSGGAGAILAALDQTTILVALTASFTAAFVGWQALRNTDSIIRNYSKVVFELEILFNHWNNLEAEERTQSEFYKMVRTAEEVMASQGREYIKFQQEALKEADLEREAGLINRVIQTAVEADTQARKAREDSIVDFTSGIVTTGEGIVTDTVNEILGTLKEEASSELVQAELEAMKSAIHQAAENVRERASSLVESLAAVNAEFDGVEIGKDTPKSVVNDVLSRYPKTDEVKG